MGHVNDGDAQPAMQLTQFVLQVFAQFLVQCAQRLVHQQDARLVNQRPGDGDPLLLAARQLRRATMSEGFELNQLEHRIDFLLALGRRQLADCQRKGNVVAYRQVREQRVALEHHADVTLVRRHIHQRFAAHQNLARAGCFEAGEHRQRGAFSRAAGAQEGQEFTVLMSREMSSTAAKFP